MLTNPNAPKGPSNIPQYKLTGATESKPLDAAGKAAYAKGQHAAHTSDEYIRMDRSCG